MKIRTERVAPAEKTEMISCAVELFVDTKPNGICGGV